MLAKLIVWGEDRSAAIARLTRALEDFSVAGVRVNVPLLLWIARERAFRDGDTSTRFLAEHLDESLFTEKRDIPPEALARAAATLLREGRAPWRIGGVGIPLRLQTDGHEIAMEANATADPKIWNIRGNYEGDVRLDERAGAGQATAESVSVNAGDRSWTFRFAGSPSSQAAVHGRAGGASGRILSPMPGKIVKVAVRDGATVAMHDLLIVLEAMKMEHRIEAPAAGTVCRIQVREGDIVASEALLLELQ